MRKAPAYFPASIGAPLHSLARSPIAYIFAFFMLLFFSLPSSAFAATYYVDATGGNDGNDGLTTGTAWKTLSTVSSLTCGSGAGELAPGDSVLFKGGEVWQAQLTVPCSGANGSQITFGSFGTGRPILRGYTAFSGSWTTSAVAFTLSLYLQRRGTVSLRTA